MPAFSRFIVTCAFGFVITLIGGVCVAANAAPANAVPWQISTFLGGESYDSIRDLVVAANGDVIVVGDDNAAFFPGEKPRAFSDVWETQSFVARFSAQGVLLKYAVFGGSGKEDVSALALDAQGRTFVVGSTNSSDWATNYLAPDARHQPARLWDYDVFIASFNADLSPRWTRLLGGDFQDFASDVAVDQNGAVYLTGTTQSSDFPVRGLARFGRNGKNTSASGVARDAFVAAITPQGALRFSTLIGGTGDDYSAVIALTQSGNIVVAGTTGSDDFPARTKITTRQSRSGNGGDVWIYKFDEKTRQPMFSTLLGGNADDGVRDMALGADGSIYLTGSTSSADFPIIADTAAQPAHSPLDFYAGQPQDAFVTRLSVDGQQLLASTFLGGSADDYGTSLAVGAAGDVWVTGATRSADFPRAQTWARELGGEREGFVAHSQGGKLVRSEFLSGDQDEEPNVIALTSNGEVWIAGETDSANFPVRRAWQSQIAGGRPLRDWNGSVGDGAYVGSDGFLMRFSAATPAPDITPPQIAIEEPQDGAKLTYLPDFAGQTHDEESGVARVELTLEAELTEKPPFEQRQNFAVGQRVYWNRYGWQAKPVEKDSSDPWGTQARVTKDAWNYSYVPNQIFSNGRGSGKRPDLLSGRYTLRVTATDRAGNSSSATSTFVVDADAQQPTVTFTSPAPDARFRAWNIIGGRVEDNSGSGVERVEVNIRRLPPNAHWGDENLDYDNVADWTGKSWVRTFYHGPGQQIWLPATYADGRWIFKNVPRGADLRPANYRILVRAYDRAGNSSEWQWRKNGLDYVETALSVRALP